MPTKSLQLLGFNYTFPSLLLYEIFALVCSQHLIGLKPGPDKLESMDDDDKLVLLLGPEALSNFKRPRKLHFLLHPSMP